MCVCVCVGMCVCVCRCVSVCVGVCRCVSVCVGVSVHIRACQCHAAVRLYRERTFAKDLASMGWKKTEAVPDEELPAVVEIIRKIQATNTRSQGIRRVQFELSHSHGLFVPRCASVCVCVCVFLT